MFLFPWNTFWCLPLCHAFLQKENKCTVDILCGSPHPNIAAQYLSCSAPRTEQVDPSNRQHENGFIFSPTIYLVKMAVDAQTMLLAFKFRNMIWSIPLINRSQESFPCKMESIKAVSPSLIKQSTLLYRKWGNCKGKENQTRTKCIWILQSKTGTEKRELKLNRELNKSWKLLLIVLNVLGKGRKSQVMFSFTPTWISGWVEETLLGKKSYLK